MSNVIIIPAKYNKTVVLPSEFIDILPKKLMLFASVQFLSQLHIVQEQLNNSGKEAILSRSKNYLFEGLVTEEGQLLGCNMENFSAKGIDIDAFLYLGDGVFHPKALLFNNEKDVICYDPKTNKHVVLKANLHNDYMKHLKFAQSKFLMSKNIGIIVTTKIGQGSPKRAEKLKHSILQRYPDKKVFTFYCNELNFQELENYNFIDIYVNVACSRIGYDDTIRSAKPIINIADVERLLKL